MHPDELGCDPFVTFVSNMLRYLAQRISQGGMPPPPLTTAATSPLSSPASCGRVLGLVRRGRAGAASDGAAGKGKAGGAGGRGFDGRRGGGAVVRGGGSGEMGLAGLEDGVGVEDGDRG